MPRTRKRWCSARRRCWRRRETFVRRRNGRVESRCLRQDSHRSLPLCSGGGNSSGRFEVEASRLKSLPQTLIRIATALPIESFPRRRGKEQLRSFRSRGIATEVAPTDSHQDRDRASYRVLPLRSGGRCRQAEGGALRMQRRPLPASGHLPPQAGEGTAGVVLKARYCGIATEVAPTGNRDACDRIPIESFACAAARTADATAATKALPP